MSGISCDYCGEILTQEEIDYPFPENGEPICNECECQYFHFQCCRCLESEYMEYRGDLLVVFDSEAGMDPGLYEIIRRPYYCQGVIGGGWIFPDSVVKLGTVPDGAESEGYPCGHLCRECSKKARRDAESLLTWENEGGCVAVTP